MRGTRVIVGAFVAMLVGCGGGGGNNPSGPVTLTGSVSFQRIPFHSSASAGLNYSAQQQLPARGITVQAIGLAQQVLATATTDANGGYSLVVPASTPVSIRANAEIVRTSPQRQFRVIDDANANQLYNFTGAAFTSSSPNGSQNLLIPSGWSSAGGATGARAAAPFAILDTVYKALLLLETVDPALAFPPLDIDWGPGNEGGQTFYQSPQGTERPLIVLSGEVNVDTDEYDEHVIAHEFGHYIEDQFSRSDSVGGPHGAGDVLDPRVAFGEGFGYAFGAIVLNAPLTRDSVGSGQSQSGFFNVDSNTFGSVGWFNESSVWSILWDLHDTTDDGSDTVSLGFDPLWDVLTTGYRDTPAVTSIFPFITELKVPLAALQRTQIDQLVEAHSIESPTIEPYGSTEVNNAGSTDDVLPIYTDIGVGQSRTVRSIRLFGDTNKLSNRRFLRFVATGSQAISINVSGPTGQDIDAIVFGHGEVLDFGFTDTNVETMTFNAAAGETYVIEVYDCANAGCNDTYAPLDTNIDVTLN
jgi:hypothetical protein